MCNLSVTEWHKKKKQTESEKKKTTWKKKRNKRSDTPNDSERMRIFRTVVWDQNQAENICFFCLSSAFNNLPLQRTNGKRNLFFIVLRWCNKCAYVDSRSYKYMVLHSIYCYANSLVYLLAVKWKIVLLSQVVGKLLLITFLVNWRYHTNAVYVKSNVFSCQVHLFEWYRILFPLSSTNFILFSVTVRTIHSLTKKKKKKIPSVSRRWCR